MDRTLLDQQIDVPTSGHNSNPQEALERILEVICVYADEDTQYAIELKYVRGILPLMELQPVPGSAHYLAGLMNYHGQSIPVVDLSLWLGSNNDEIYSLHTPIVMCGDGYAQMAFIVNEVFQIEALQPVAVHLQELFDAGNTPFKASLKLDSGIALLLDMQSILNINFLGMDLFSSPMSLSPETKF
jgi:chemotaxis signal transduction protein